MSRLLLANILPGVFLVFCLCLGAQGSEGFNCSKTLRDPGLISPAQWYYEAVLGTEQVLTCRICKYSADSVRVSWLRDGAPISQSGRVHYSHSHGEEFSLRLRTVSASDLGNYTCSLSLVAGARHLDSATIILDKRPPPPLFVGLKDGVNRTSQLLTWTGESRMPIIHFLLEFRLRPLTGAGEDWVSLVIPYDSRATVQSYLLRGLTTATSYQARIRTKTRHGKSFYSPTWQFTTWSPWTTSSPVTIFSLPRRDQGEKKETQWEHKSEQTKHNFAKEFSSFSGVELQHISSSIFICSVIYSLLSLVSLHN